MKKKLKEQKKGKLLKGNMLSFTLSILPIRSMIGSQRTNQEFICELQNIIDVDPSFYPAYPDMGTSLLFVDTESATKTLDIAFEICINYLNFRKFDKMH